MTLHCGDSLAYLKTLPDNCVDAVVTDPPYFKFKGEYWDRQWDTADGFLSWLGEYLDQFARVLRANGSVYVFASPQMSARVEVETAKRFNVLNHIVWLKPKNQGKHMANNKESLRSYFPNTERIVFAEHYGADNAAKGEAGYAKKCDELRGFLFEPLRSWFIREWGLSGLTRQQVDKYFNTSNCTQYWFLEREYQIPTKQRYEGLQKLAPGYFRREYEDLRREYEDLRRPFAVTKDVPYTDVWEFATVGYYEGKHPCEKPADLLQHIIRTSTRPGAVVLDPFMGSGSTGLAALAFGRDFIGCELDDRYFRMASERLTHAAQCTDMDIQTTDYRPELPKVSNPKPLEPTTSKTRELELTLFS